MCNSLIHKKNEEKNHEPYDMTQLGINQRAIYNEYPRHKI